LPAEPCASSWTNFLRLIFFLKQARNPGHRLARISCASRERRTLRLVFDEFPARQLLREVGAGVQGQTLKIIISAPIFGVDIILSLSK